MRLSRYQVLSQSAGIVHLYWKCHNSEYLLDRTGTKKLFFQSLIAGLKHRGIEANPIRAGMVKLEKLRYYFWNSYRFYAHGIVDQPRQNARRFDGASRQCVSRL